MGKLFLILFTISVLIGCKKQPERKISTNISTNELQTEKLPPKAGINSKALAILEDWKPFKDLESGFDAVYTAENREDLILVVEDLVEKQNLLAESEYPDDFDIPQIKGRQKVLKTFILKAKAALENRVAIEEPMMEMLTSYNALRNQFNVTVNNTLPTELDLDE